VLAGCGGPFVPDMLYSPPIASFSPSFSSSSINGTDGTIIAGGTSSGDYLYWDAVTGSWIVGSTAINIGAGTLAGFESVAVGFSGKCDVVWYLLGCRLVR